MLMPTKNKKNAAAHKKHRESLSPDDKVRILTNNAAAHKKQRESLSPDDKVQILTNNAAEQKKTPIVSIS